MTDPRPCDTADAEPSQSGLDIDIRTDEAGWEKYPSFTAKIATILTQAFQAEFPEAPAVELSVVLSGDEAVQILNRDYRTKDKATNILSFPASDPETLEEEIDFALQGGPPVHLGDLVLALGVLEREAADQNKTFDDHGTHLLVHGLLHLLGYDHIEDSDAEVMEDFEREILAAMGIADPYAHEQ